MGLINGIKKKLGLVDLRAAGQEWVRNEFGEEWVAEFNELYSKYELGIPLGKNGTDTRTFEEMLETIKKEM